MEISIRTGQTTTNPAGAPDVRPAKRSGQQGGEFARMKDLTGKLLRVPKTELDERRKTES